MAEGSQNEREIRAARNQSLFRSVNEKLRELNTAFTLLPDTWAIACECADATCVQILEIASDGYAEVRRHPHRFVVRRGHVSRDVEVVVEETDAYAVVEKRGAGADVAEALHRREDAGQ